MPENVEFDWRRLRVSMPANNGGLLRLYDPVTNKCVEISVRLGSPNAPANPLRGGDGSGVTLAVLYHMWIGPALAQFGDKAALAYYDAAAGGATPVMHHPV